MTPDQLEHAFAELELARRRRELLLWTVRAWVGVVLLLGLAAAALVALACGDPLQVHLLLGAGAAGASGGLVARRRR